MLVAIAERTRREFNAALTDRRRRRRSERPAADYDVYSTCAAIYVHTAHTHICLTPAVRWNRPHDALRRITLMCVCVCERSLLPTSRRCVRASGRRWRWLRRVRHSECGRYSHTIQMSISVRRLCLRHNLRSQMTGVHIISGDNETDNSRAIPHR